MGVRRLAVVNGPNIFQMLLVNKIILIKEYIVVVSGRDDSTARQEQCLQRSATDWGSASMGGTV